MNITLYGIHNCDTVKKARRWLDEHGIAYRYHDFRKDGLTPGQVDTWLAALGPEALINRRGTTYRALDEASRQRLESHPTAVLCEQPALIRRPLIDCNGEFSCGFSAAAFASQFS